MYCSIEVPGIRKDSITQHMIVMVLMHKERKQVEDNYNICRYTNFCCKLVFSLILLITLLQRSQIMSSYEETNFLQLFVDSRCKGGESKGGMIFAAFSEGTAATLCYI